MKKIILVISLIAGYSTQAQQQELIDNFWYLEKLVIDGEEFFPPDNEEVSPEQIGVEFSESDIQVGSGCNWMAGEVIYFDESNTFESGSEGWAVSLFECGLEENNIFENHYFYEFWSINFTEILDPFHYEIQSEGDNLSLVVTNSLGSEAYYNNYVLSTHEIDSNTQNLFGIFPNPFHDKLTIENPELKITSVRITDTSGKLVVHQSFSVKRHEIDFTHLPSGVYFISFEENGKVLKTEKLIKK